MERRR
jgi:hypothetical protein